MIRRAATIAICAQLGCAKQVSVPDLGAMPHGPVWPPAPNEPQVSWVGHVDLAAMGVQRPMDVACTRGHQLAIADPDGPAVWTLNLNTGEYATLQTVDAHRMVSPIGVGWHRGDVVIADPGAEAIYRTRGPRRRRATVLHHGAPMTRPTAVMTLGNETLLIVDAGGHQLLRMSDTGDGINVESGERGEVGTGFNFPVDAAVASNGEIFVADALNAVVQGILNDEIRLVAGGQGHGALVRPKGIALDNRGQLHVVDGGMQHVQVYTPTGELVGRYAQPGDGEGELSLPAGICIDEHDHIFVADSLNRRLQIYQLRSPDPE